MTAPRASTWVAGDEAMAFLEMLRPGGPWLLLAIEPDPAPGKKFCDIIGYPCRTVAEVCKFVSKHNGTRNLYYSLNPTRKTIGKKPRKIDLSAIEYIPSDLDPKPDETPADAKARYIAELDHLGIRPTAIVDSGNGLNALLKLEDPIILPEPDVVEFMDRKGQPFLETVFERKVQRQIDDVEARAKALMLALDSVAGTQNIDRILRLPGTTNLPNKPKRAAGRVPCQSKLISFDPDATFRLEDFPEPTKAKAEAKPRTRPASRQANASGGSSPDQAQERTAHTGSTVLPKRAISLLKVPDNGAGVKYCNDKYESRSGVLFAFLLMCRKANIAEHIIYEGCIYDEAYAGGAIREHCLAQADHDSYLGRQIERAANWAEEHSQASSASPEIDRLARMPREEYEKTRKQAAKAMGFRVSVLDDMVAQARGGGGDTSEADEEVERINVDHALVLAGNKASVMKFEGAATKFRLLQVGAFKTWFTNQRITVGDESVWIADCWMSHPKPRQYAGIEFAPTGTTLPDGYYNLWQGFAVEPKEGDCSKFLAHVKDNVARGDEATYLWIIGWWAQILQQPSIKMETAIAMRGPQGAGKSKLGEVMGSLIGEAHYLQVSAPRYITGQFNSHMASMLVLQAEEAFWAGDKKAEGVLKDLVSGKVHMLEYKGVDPIRIKNFIRFYVTGNSEWIVPAGFRDRRWAIFDIGEAQMQNNDYFAAIDKEMDNGGREALLHHLLNFDLTQVNLRKIPKNAALFDQQLEGMDAEQAWWFEALMRGSLPSRPPGIGEHDVCLRDDLFETYVLHARLQGIARRSIETKIGMFLKKQLGAKLGHPRPFVGQKQLHCYKLPPLAECRQRFAEQLGQAVDWGDEWESDKWQQNDDWLDMLMKATGGRKKSFFDY